MTAPPAAPAALPLDDPEVALIFGLALAGYTALGGLLVASGRGRPGWARAGTWLAWVAVTTLTTHALLIWALRFGWDPAIATRNGYAGFVTFHLAWLLLVVSLPRWRAASGGPVVVPGIAWLLVTPGVLAAPLRYPLIGGLAVPVFVAAALGAVGVGVLVVDRWRRRRARRG